MDPVHVKGVNTDDDLILINKMSYTMTQESKLAFVLFYLVASVIFIFIIRFFLVKIDITVIIDPELDSEKRISFNALEEFEIVPRFIKMNSEKIQRLHSLVREEKGRGIKELIAAFFLTFGSIESKTEPFVNSALEECEFLKLFDHCISLGIKSYEDIIRYIFTIVAKSFMQKVIENFDSNKEGEPNEEDSFIRRIDKAISAIEGDVAALNYLFKSNRCTGTLNFMR